MWDQNMYQKNGSTYLFSHLCYFVSGGLNLILHKENKNASNVQKWTSQYNIKQIEIVRPLTLAMSPFEFRKTFFLEKIFKYILDRKAPLLFCMWLFTLT